MSRSNKGIQELILHMRGRGYVVKPLHRGTSCMEDFYERLICPIKNSQGLFKLSIELVNEQILDGDVKVANGVLYVKSGLFNIEDHFSLDSLAKKKDMAERIYRAGLLAVDHVDIDSKVFEYAYNHICKSGFRNVHCCERLPNRSKTYFCEQWVDADIQHTTYSIRVCNSEGAVVLDAGIDQIETYDYLAAGRPRLKMSWPTNNRLRVRFGDPVDRSFDLPVSLS